MSVSVNAIDARDEMLKTIAEANNLCIHAQYHYQRAASADEDFYRIEFSALFDDKSLKLNSAVEEATIGTAKLQRAFSLIHQNSYLNHRFPVLMSPAGSIHTEELERLSSAVFLGNNTCDQKESLYSSMMQFVRKREQLSIHQQSLLAAVDVQIRSGPAYMTYNTRGAGRRREHPVNYFVPDSPQQVQPTACTNIEPIPYSHQNYPRTHHKPETHVPLHPHSGRITSGRGQVGRNQHSAIQKPSIRLQREEEFEPLPLVNDKDSEDLHRAHPSQDRASPIITGDIFHQNDGIQHTSIQKPSIRLQREEVFEPLPVVNDRDLEGCQRPEPCKDFHKTRDSWSGNQTRTQGTEGNRIQQRSIIVTPTTAENLLSSEGTVTIMDCNRSLNPPRQHNEKLQPPKRREHQNQQNDSFALALGGRVDFIERDFHHAHSEGDLPFYDAGRNVRDKNSGNHCKKSRSFSH